MWSFQKQIIQPNKTLKFNIQKNNHLCTWSVIINAWKTDTQFRQFYNSILADCEFPAFYWEHPVYDGTRSNSSYEFVLVNSQNLLNTHPNPVPFLPYFEKGHTVVGFHNLGRDAYLIVPAPLHEKTTYAHLADFVRNAPLEQLDALWKKTGDAFLEYTQTNPKWLNTAGMGVAWLHIRIDSRPKYYKYLPYRNPDFYLQG